LARADLGQVIGRGCPGGLVDETKLLGFTAGHLRVDPIDSDPVDVPNGPGPIAIGIKEE
jgi:hypothetical protein